MITKVINGKEYLFVDEASMIISLDRGIGDKDSEPVWLSGNYKIIGKASELIEEQWRGIVKMGGLKTFKDYTYIYEPDLDGLFNALLEMKFQTATESGLSLISSLDLEPETTLIIQK